MHPVLAHQGGWDEIALVGGPVILLGLVLVFANRRADRIAEERGHSTSDPKS